MLPQKGRIWAEDMVSFFPIIVESTKLNAEFTSIEDVHFRDVVSWRAVCLPHAKAIEAAAFFFLGFPLSAIICNSRSLAVLPYFLRFDVISVLQSFSLDLQNNCLDVLHFYLQYALQYLILICSWKLNFVRKKITISYVAFVGLSEHKTPPGLINTLFQNVRFHLRLVYLCIKLSTSEKFDLDRTFYIWKLEPGSAWEKSPTNFSGILACP